MRLYGSKSLQWGGFEAQRLIDWLVPVVLTAGLTYATSWIASLTEAGGWRAIAASVLVMLGRGVYQWCRDNSNDRT